MCLQGLFFGIWAVNCHHIRCWIIQTCTALWTYCIQASGTPLTSSNCVILNFCSCIFQGTLFYIHLVFTIFILFYILDCRCNNESSMGIVQLFLYGMHFFCGWVLRCTSKDRSICSWTLITVTIFIFCLSSIRMCISDCIWNTAIETCAYMTRWATTVAAYLYATWIILWSSWVKLVFHNELRMHWIVKCGPYIQTLYFCACFSNKCTFILALEISFFQASTINNPVYTIMEKNVEKFCKYSGLHWKESSHFCCD